MVRSRYIVDTTVRIRTSDVLCYLPPGNIFVLEAACKCEIPFWSFQRDQYIYLDSRTLSNIY